MMKKSGYAAMIGLAAFLISGAVVADPPAHKGNPHHSKQKEKHHGKSKGYKTVKSLPPGHRVVTSHGKRYYVHEGHYYEPYDGHFRIVSAPIGLHIDILPGGISTVLVAGNPYFYFSGTYYKRLDHGYVVVKAPVESSAAIAGLIVYPAEGQSNWERMADSDDCYDWAQNETGVVLTDRTPPGHRKQFQGAMATCLSARGYEIG